MKKIALIGLVLLALVCISCAQDDGGQEIQEGEAQAEIRELTAAELALVEASGEFGFNLFDEMVAKSDGENVFISALSISMALGMTYNGARGTTRTAMAQVLDYGDLSLEEVNQNYRSLIQLLTTMDPEVTMEIANSIWGREGFIVLEEFLDLCQAYFDAVVEALDFNDPGAAEAINAWVGEKTHDKITEIISPPISEDMMMYLINAIYFKGAWALQFDPEDTVDKDFHLPDSTTKTVKMMHLLEDMPYQSTEQLRAVDLPYGGGNFAMAILLPHEGRDIDQLIAELNAEQWKAILQGFETNYMIFEMPRFELEYDAGDTLIEVLSALGMGVAFVPGQADFTGITTTMPLWIDEVKHKTYVKVNEEGTEAAAVTVVGVGTGAPGSISSMIVDRPYIVVIHDRHSGAVLFMGKIVDPPSF